MRYTFSNGFGKKIIIRFPIINKLQEKINKSPLLPIIYIRYYFKLINFYFF